MKNIFVVFIFSLSALTFAQISPRRVNSEDFQTARTRNLAQLPSIIQFQTTSAWSQAGGFDKLNFSEVPDVGSMEKLIEIFNYERDTKFLKGQSGTLPERRLSWLYPDDGCYVRAEMMVRFALEKQYPEPYKFFSFGNLAVKTHNHPDGVVRWWYHVVPVYRVGNQAYALDPSIDHRGPMTAEEWKKSQEGDGPVDKFMICKPHTYDPEANCSKPNIMPFEAVRSSQVNFLYHEWHRIEKLGRNPELELGAHPPWL